MERYMLLWPTFGKVIRSRERMERILLFKPGQKWIVLSGPDPGRVNAL